ncbi:MAG: hypothetical protein HQL52_01620 [Magnetococcales bacterium]|nr:hypothetical protein [Magnetococcales bacterium]
MSASPPDFPTGTEPPAKPIPTDPVDSPKGDGGVLAPIKKRHIFGIGLPKRDQKITLVWVPGRYKMQLPGAEELSQRWNRQFEAGEMATLLGDIAAYLTKMLKASNLTLEERSNRLKMALLYAFPVMENIYFRYRKKVTIPASDAYSAMLNGAIQAAEALLKGYGNLFDLYYRRPNYRYAKIRDQVPETAFHILELIWLLQHLNGLLYRNLPPVYLGMANKLYFMLRSYESVEERYHHLSSSGLGLETGLAGFSVPHLGTDSFESLYIKIQLWSMLDSQRWSPSDLHFLTAFLESHKNQVRIDPCDGQAPGKGEALIAFGQEIPPVLGQGEPGKKRDYLFSLEAIRNVLEGYLKGGLGEVSGGGNGVTEGEPLFRLHPMERPHLLQGLKRDFSLGSVGIKRPHFRKDPDLHLFFGFMNAYAMIRNRREKGAEKFREESSFHLTLARSSSVLTNVEDKRDLEEINQWQIDPEVTGRGEIQLHLIEGYATRPFRIGTMVAFARPPDYTFSVGYVSRIVREEENLVDFSVRLLSADSQPSLIHRLFEEDEAGDPLKIIHFRKGKRMFCLYPRLPGYHPLLRMGETVSIPFNDKHYKFKLGQITYGGPEIMIRELLPPER